MSNACDKCKFRFNPAIQNHECNADGWIYHYSNKSPVDGGTIVDVEYDSSVMNMGLTHKLANEIVWGSVVKWRLHPGALAVQKFGRALRKQPRYTNSGGRDFIDECIDNYTPEEFRGAMKFTIGKYLSRLGKKDSVESEVKKIADYANRWLSYERNIKNKN